MADTSTIRQVLAGPIAAIQTGAISTAVAIQQGPKQAKDCFYGGSGRISGTVKVKGTPDYAVYRRVRLITERDGVCIREVWSDPTTGAYSFDYIDETLAYTVLSYDYTHSFRATIADNLTPEIIA